MFKSIKTGVLAAILISTAIIAQAQKKMTEGTATYTMEYALTAEQEPMAAMLPKESKIKFNGNFSKVEMEQGPAQITIIKDGMANEGLVLIDVPVAQMQMAVKQTKADFDKANGDVKFVDFKNTGEKQIIAGFNAEKYTYKDDKGGGYELWATTELELPKGLSYDHFKDVKGAVIKSTATQNGVKATSTLKEIVEGKVGALTLEIPSGYELKTMQEVMAMSGGGE